MRNTATKLFTALLLLLVTVGALSGCGGKQTNVSVKITSPDNTIVDTNVTVTDNNPTASKAVIAACKANNIAYTVNNGMFDGFGGVESTNDDGWLFYQNGTLAQTGAETTQIQEGDVIEFRYENYTKAFSEPNTDFLGKWVSEPGADGSFATLTLEDGEASFNYVDSERTVFSYAGAYSIMNDEITINDIVSNSPVKIPFSLQGDTMVITYNAASLTLTKQAL